MSARWVRGLMAWGAGLLLCAALAAPASAQTAITQCGPLNGMTSYILTADISSTGTCLNVTGSGTTINLNGHRITGVRGSGFGIAGSPGNNVTIKGPGVIHDFESCILLGTPPQTFPPTPPHDPGYLPGVTGGSYAMVEDVMVYNCDVVGIKLGYGSKCVECRVHDVRGSEADGVGIHIGNRSIGGCLLEASIVEWSDYGAIVGPDCKVWDLVVDTVGKSGLVVGAGTSVARTVISHYHDGPGLDYTACITGTTNQTANGCQDSSNSVTLPTATVATTAIANPVAPGAVIPDCGTNAGGVRYPGFPAAAQCGAQCSPDDPNC